MGLCACVHANFELLYLPIRKQSKLFLSYLLGEESKVPNMQEVVRKLLNALYHSVMNHVVRQLTFFSSDRAFRFFYVAFPEVK